MHHSKRGVVTESFMRTTREFKSSLRTKATFHRNARQDEATRDN